MKKLISILLVIVCLTSLGSCNKDNNTNQEPVETEPLSAYEQLNDEEKLLYEALILFTTGTNGVITSKSPTVRVLAVGYMTLESKMVQVQLQETEDGETYSIPYFIGNPTQIQEQKGVTSYHPGSKVYHNQNGKVDCGNINRALKEYWDAYYEDMGLN